jgi:phage baseplate assembly protein V
MLRFGTISEVDGDKGLVRVQFEDAGIVSAWLPMIQKGTKGNRYFAVPDKQEHVAVLMDENSENGVCLGSIYSSAELPGSVKGKDVAGVLFSDGTVIKYDRASKTLTVSGPDYINVQCEQANIEAEAVTIEATDINLTGDVHIDGNLDISGTTQGDGSISTKGEVTAKSATVPIGLSTHKHTGVTPGSGVSATPIP